MKNPVRRNNLGDISYTSRVMADFVSNFVAMATGVGCGRVLHYPLLFHPENDFSGFLDPQNLDKDSKFITPGQMQMELCWA